MANNKTIRITVFLLSTCVVFLLYITCPRIAHSQDEIDTLIGKLENSSLVVRNEAAEVLVRKIWAFAANN